MALSLQPGFVLGALSGVAMVALGVALLLVKPRRRTSVLFGSFAVLWGFGVLLANVGRSFDDPAERQPLLNASAALFVPLYVPLLGSVLALAHPKASILRRPLLAAAAALPGILGLVVVLALPATLSDPIVSSSILVANALVAFAAALALVWRRLRDVDDEVAKQQLVLVTAALAAYVGYQAVALLSLDAVFLADFIALQGVVSVGIELAGAATALGVLAYVVAGSLRRKDLPWRDLTLATIFIPPVFALVETGLGTQGVQFTFIGVWRLAMVALFAYALLRYKLFDIELKMKSLAGVAAWLGVAIGVIFGAALFAGDRLTRFPIFGLAVVAGSVAMSYPAARLSSLALDRARPDMAEQDYVYKRKVDVYRAALAEIEASDSRLAQTDDRVLASLRKGLGISDKEHRLLTLMLRAQEARSPATATRSPQQKYKIEKELGKGSFGRAVLATDLRLDRKVVLKQALVPWTIDEQGRERFLQEARLAARIQHPNVVAIYDVDVEDELPMMVLEYVPGGSLEARLKQGAVPPAEAAALVAQMARGLAAIHRAGIVHRDLKPANILVGASGEPKITDFGVARPPQDAEALAKAAGGAQPGSLAYMSPEQAMGDEIDQRSDLYSLGVVAYELLAGRHPIEMRGMREMQLKAAIVALPAPLPIAGVPDGINAALAKALAKDPTQRFQSAEEMAEAFAAGGGVALPVEPSFGATQV